MKRLKKIGIGFVMTMGLFFVIMINAATDERENIHENSADIDDIPRTLNDVIKKSRPIIIEDREQELEEKIKLDKLSDKELQTIILGFEAYNKSIKKLKDMCINVESENDFRAFEELISEHGAELMKVTTGYGLVRNTLITEGYAEHPELGPLLDDTEILVNGVIICMEILAWEFNL